MVIGAEESDVGRSASKQVPARKRGGRGGVI